MTTLISLDKDVSKIPPSNISNESKKIIMDCVKKI